MAVERDEDRELVWTGPGGSLIRPMTREAARQATLIVGILFAAGGASGIPLAAGWVDVEGVRPGVAVATIVGAWLGTLVMHAARSWSPETMERWIPPVTIASQFGALVVITGAVVSFGPELGVAAIFYVETPLVTFIFYRARWAWTLTALVLVAYAIGLALIEAPAPGQQLLIIITAAVATSVLVGDLARRSDDARRAERRARQELAHLNEHLEARVEEQVDELERVGQLRRFLAPQVADVVVTRGSEALLEPHRRDVAVLFCDLRGFTRFTNAVAPEVVVGVLGEYYATVGPILEAHGATIGGYEGDGIMAYLGDPIPRRDAAAAGVAMARAIGSGLEALVARWREHGHDLGYGIGLAHGPATLGVVGFDGRFDYTALGAVVNLAARLCADAASGEIVVDDSMCEVAQLDGGCRHRGHVTLKGFDASVSTYALLR